MEILVTKFGGSSLADGTQFRKVRDIIQADDRRRFVVASAPGKRYPEDHKVTDLLLECYYRAKGGSSFEGQLGEIQTRFEDIAAELDIDYSAEQDIEVLRKHLRENPDRDYIASRGEYLNSRILAMYLGYAFVDPAECVIFNNDSTCNFELTIQKTRETLASYENAVVAGFYGAYKNGRICTFSRGGSDVTGSIVAMAVDAAVYENWTDVSGLLAADPRIVDNPRSVRYISCRELRTLSYMGASVLHTDAVLPASEAGIPINIRNTNCPDDPGTMIVKKLPKDVKRHAITGVAGRKGMSAIQIEKVMVSDGAGFSAIMLELLKKRQLPFEICMTGIDSITILIKTEILDKCKKGLLDEIESVLSPDFIGIKDNISLIAVVGEKATEVSDANIKVLHALDKAGVEVTTINQGAGKLNLFIGVPEESYEKAIRAIYKKIDE